MPSAEDDAVDKLQFLDSFLFCAGAETHRIELDEYPKMGIDNYIGLWQEIKTFLRPDRTSNYCPPLFCMVREYRSTLGVYEPPPDGFIPPLEGANYCPPLFCMVRYTGAPWGFMNLPNSVLITVHHSSVHVRIYRSTLDLGELPIRPHQSIKNVKFGL